MKKHYYGFYNSYGVQTIGGDGSRIGHVEVFDSKTARDKWVSSERWDGRNWHREAITAREARSEIVHCCEFFEFASYYSNSDDRETNIKAFINYLSEHKLSPLD